FDRHELLSLSDLVVVDVQIADDGDVVPKGKVSLQIEVALQTGLFPANIGDKFDILEPIAQTKGIFLSVDLREQIVVEAEGKGPIGPYLGQKAKRIYHLKIHPHQGVELIGQYHIVDQGLGEQIVGLWVYRGVLSLQIGLEL